jgi:transcription elongation factor
LIRWLEQAGKKLLLDGAWVRFRRGDMRGDLGLVVESSGTDDSVTVAAVPRMSPVYAPTTPKRRKTAANPQMLFDPESVEAAFGKGSVISAGGKFVFQNRTYICGLLLRKVAATHGLVEAPRPSLDELLLFRQSGWKEIASLVEDAVHRESIRNTWQAGDQVDITGGELRGLSGELKAISLDQWSAEITPLPDATNTILQVSLDSLVRRVPVGANVVVVAGRSKECRGITVSSTAEYITFIEDKSRKEVSS